MIPPRSLLRWAPAVVLSLTVAQLAVAQWVPGIERFADKAFGARLVLYPLLMLAVPAAWWWRVGRRRPDAVPPHGAFTLVMAGFLVDATGNSLDLYDAVVWWDDVNHLVNWFLLTTGLGLLLGGAVRPRGAVVALVTGLGALLAVGWELGEWATFIRHGTELAEAYDDTLADEALGTLGALGAGLLVRRLLPGTLPGTRAGTAPTGTAQPDSRAARRGRAAYLVLLGATVAVLLVQVVAPGTSADPAAGARLALYPLVAGALPLGWWWHGRHQRHRVAGPVPWWPASLVVLPLLLDSVGNVTDVYARVTWWDDASHLLHWLLLAVAAAAVLAPLVRPGWALLLLVTGLGSALAVAWELFERVAYYGADAGTAAVYEDTLADQALGTLGAVLGAGLVLGWASSRGRRSDPAQGDTSEVLYAAPGRD